eukprot:gene14560-10407_t
MVYRRRPLEVEALHAHDAKQSRVLLFNTLPSTMSLAGSLVWPQGRGAGGEERETFARFAALWINLWKRARCSAVPVTRKVKGSVAVTEVEAEAAAEADAVGAEDAEGE